MITGCWYCGETIANGQEWTTLFNGRSAHVKCAFQAAREEELIRERAKREADAQTSA